MVPLALTLPLVVGTTPVTFALPVAPLETLPFAPALTSPALTPTLPGLTLTSTPPTLPPALGADGVLGALGADGALGALGGLGALTDGGLGSTDGRDGGETDGGETDGGETDGGEGSCAIAVPAVIAVVATHAHAHRIAFLRSLHRAPPPRMSFTKSLSRPACATASDRRHGGRELYRARPLAQNPSVCREWTSISTAKTV